jgi:hypothetical protein
VRYNPRQFWRNLPRPKANESLVERMLRVFTGLVRSVSPYNFLVGWKRLPGSLPGDVYVLGWFVILIAASVAVQNNRSELVSWLILILCVGRLLDVYTTQLGIVLVDSTARDHYLQSIERSVILAVLNVGQAVVCFGWYRIP